MQVLITRMKFNLGKLFYFSVGLVARSARALCELDWRLVYKWGYPLFWSALKYAFKLSCCAIAHSSASFIFRCSEVCYGVFWSAWKSMVSGGTQKWWLLNSFALACDPLQPCAPIDHQKEIYLIVQIPTVPFELLFGAWLEASIPGIKQHCSIRWMKIHQVFGSLWGVIDKELCILTKRRSFEFPQRSNLPDYYQAFSSDLSVQLPWCPTGSSICPLHHKSLQSMM